jgi:CO dehydrogenase maturation factor
MSRKSRSSLITHHTLDKGPIVTVTIAMAGKGGVGKTTLSAMILKRLCQRAQDGVLAIDADPSSNLNSVLGLDLESTVGDVREETADRSSNSPIPVGIPKRDYLAYRIEDALVEGEGLDLIAMGRPEGPGCYCAANHVLRECVDRIAGSYQYVVIDNEAGLEHLSRRTTRDVDILLVVSDPTVRGIIAAGRIAGLVNELQTQVGKVYLVVNRVEGDLSPALVEEIQRQGLQLAGMVPSDRQVGDFDRDGKPLVELPEDSAVYSSVRDIVDRMLDGKS